MKDETTLACARLVREGAVPRAELPALEHPEVRRSVEQRLAAVGLELASSAYSEHHGLRLSPEACAGSGPEAASNVGLKSDACALLVVLWARLVMQKRAATDSGETPGEAAALFPEQGREAAREFRPSVRFDTLLREFSHVVGSRSHLRRLVTQLRRLGFVTTRGELIEAGPFLELGLDGERLVSWVRREVLADLVRAREGGEAAAVERGPDPLEAALLEVLRDAERPLSRGELARAVERRPIHASKALKSLVESGRVLREGVKGQARYILPASAASAAEEIGDEEE